MNNHPKIDLQSAAERVLCGTYSLADIENGIAEEDRYKVAEDYLKQKKVLDAHRRFHSKVGCPGLPECPVCVAEKCEV